MSDGGEIAVASPGDDDVAPGLGTLLLYDAETLSADPATISLGTGGTQGLDLQAGAGNAGRTYLIGGSITGTTPGLPLPGGHTLPLTYDAYTALTLFAPGPPIAGSLGVLGAGGGGVAAFGLPPGLSPSLVGLTIYHAFLVVAWRRRG